VELRAVTLGRITIGPAAAEAPAERAAADELVQLRATIEVVTETTSDTIESLNRRVKTLENRSGHTVRTYPEGMATEASTTPPERPSSEDLLRGVQRIRELGHSAAGHAGNAAAFLRRAAAQRAQTRRRG
jgi:hypothetical protein